MVRSHEFDEEENPTFIDECNIDGKKGLYFKGEDVIYFDVGNDFCGEYDAELSPPAVMLTAFGDGLYSLFGDIFCTYPLLGTTVNDSSVIFDYKNYRITVSWTDSGGKRINPKWAREYK